MEKPGGAWSRGEIAERGVRAGAGPRKRQDSRMNGGQLVKQTRWAFMGRGEAEQEAAPVGQWQVWSG